MTKEEILKLEGRELDTAVAGMMEPMPEPITAKDLRAKVGMKEWYSVNYVESPGGWWKAQIGTDHNLDEHGTFYEEKDSEMVRWIPALEPSADMNAAWRVVEEVTAIAHFREWWREEDLCFASAQEAAKEICLNALLVASGVSQGRRD